MKNAGSALGREDGKCGGLTRSGRPCQQPAGWGTSHVGAGTCKLHLGSTPTHVTHGLRKLAEQQARKSLAEMDVREVVDPIAEFARLTSEVVALKDFFAGHVASLEDRLRFTDDKGSEQLRAEVALYERALDRAGKLLGEWVRLGMEDRLVRLDEARFALVERGLEAYRRAADIDEDRHAAGIKAMAGELRRAG